MQEKLWASYRRLEDTIVIVDIQYIVGKEKKDGGGRDCRGGVIIGSREG